MVSQSSVRQRAEMTRAQWSRAAWPLRVILLVMAAFGLPSCGTPSAADIESTELLFRNASSAVVSGADEAPVLTGQVYVVAETRPVASRVVFYLGADGADGEPVHVDEDVPFEFALDTTGLIEGEHLLTALVTRQHAASDQTRTVEAEFLVDNDNDAEPPTPSPEPQSHAWSLRGDPSFDESALSDEARMWYRRLWSAIEHPDQTPNANDEMAGGSLRSYGYTMQQHMFYLFTALRATGDLRFVDEIARLADIAASRLTTEWYDAGGDDWYRPTDGTDGYRRWVYLRSGDTKDRTGKDTDRISVYKTHAWVAVMAYVFDLNRGLPSPSGVDYGAKADFWLDYLLNDFEAIHHIRRGTSHPEDFFRYQDSVGTSVLHSQLTYHYYMYLLTGDDERLAHADREAENIAKGMFVAPTPLGDAIIFGKPRDPENGLVPITYARYTYALHADLALQGHPLFGDPAYMAMHARTLAHFVMDNGSVDLAFDVGGMQDRTGVSWWDGDTEAKLPTQNPYTGSSLTWGRESFSRYAIGYFAPLAVFGETERIAEITVEAYGDKESKLENPKRLAIPVGMLLVHAQR